MQDDRDPENELESSDESVEMNPDVEVLESDQQFDSEDDELTVEMSGVDPLLPIRKRRVPNQSMWGRLEIAMVAIGAFLLLITFIFYIGFVVPAQREQESDRIRRSELDRELIQAREKWGDIRTTETGVARLITSAEDFESRSLKDESIGTTAVYQRINVLINAFGLRNTSGPDYVPLVSSDAGPRREGDTAKRGRDKYMSLFPGIYITTTVEGAYPNIRRFVREIETSNEFVAITSLELEPADDQKSQADTQTIDVRDEKGRKVTKTFKKGRFRGNVVSLRIEMAAYFRRPADQRLNTASLENSDKDTEATD